MAGNLLRLAWSNIMMKHPMPPQSRNGAIPGVAEMALHWSQQI